MILYQIDGRWTEFGDGRMLREQPAPDGLCNYKGCVYLTGHIYRFHSWEVSL